MFSADAELQILARFAPTFRRHANERADAVDINGDKRIARDDAFGKIIGEESAGIVAADADGRLREIVGAEGKELRRLRNIAG